MMQTMSTNTQHRFDNESDFSESAFNVDLYGRVQGVGMRPWLFRLAQSHELLGQIFNHFAGTSAVLQGARGSAFSLSKKNSHLLCPGRAATSLRKLKNLFSAKLNLGNLIASKF
jgi:acylphosphatase